MQADRPDDAQQLPRATPVVLAALVLWLALAVAAVLVLWRERVQTLEQARQDATRLSAVLEENTARSFEKVGVALGKAWPDGWAGPTIPVTTPG